LCCGHKRFRVERGPLLSTREGVVSLGRKVTAFSDLTGAEVPEDELGKLVVKSHPDLDAPVFLEALPGEVTGLDKTNLQVVMVEWQPPGEGEPKSFMLLVKDFNALARNGSMADLLTNAPAAKGGRRAPSGDIDYATLEHAGRPHQGRVSPAEAEFARNNLSAVNERLAREGKRLIDPTNAEHKERYGL
jgi:hypothetical protein